MFFHSRLFFLPDQVYLAGYLVGYFDDSAGYVYGHFVDSIGCEFHFGNVFYQKVNYHNHLKLLRLFAFVLTFIGT